MSWAAIRGQEAAREQVLRCWRSGRWGHAYALTGPPGIGKRLFARELAKALMCERGTGELAACDRCPSCLQVMAGTHPDVHVVRTPEGKHSLPVEQMREFCAGLWRKPLRGGWVVGIVEDAEEMNAESANAFLKTLEEPPAGVVILLVASSWERLLPTIRSRCQQVSLQPLRREEVAAILTEHGVEEEAVREAALRWCRGSASRALAIAKGGLWELREALLGALAEGKVEVEGWVRRCLEYAEGAGKDAAAQRERAELVLDVLLEGLREGLRWGVIGGTPSHAEESRHQALGQCFGVEQLLDWQERTLQAYEHLDRRVPLTLIFESLFEHYAQACSGWKAPRTPAG
jgi:DNA polymerase-3 subunit delta'